LIRFSAIATVGLTVQLAALAALAYAAHLPMALATLCAVELAILHNCGWPERWTWRGRAADGLRGRLRRLIRFHVGAGLVSLAGNVVVTVVLTDSLHTPVVVANVIAVALLGIANFCAVDRFVFQRR